MRVLTWAFVGLVSAGCGKPGAMPVIKGLAAAECAVDCVCSTWVAREVDIFTESADDWHSSGRPERARRPGTLEERTIHGCYPNAEECGLIVKWVTDDAVSILPCYPYHIGSDGAAHPGPRK